MLLLAEDSVKYCSLSIWIPRHPHPRHAHATPTHRTHACRPPRPPQILPLVEIAPTVTPCRHALADLRSCSKFSRWSKLLQLLRPARRTTPHPTRTPHAPPQTSATSANSPVGRNCSDRSDLLGCSRRPPQLQQILPLVEIAPTAPTCSADNANANNRKKSTR